MTSAGSIGRAAISIWWTRWSNSPTIRTRSASKASASSVGRTVPSIEFSKGTSARSLAPLSTASTAAGIVATGSGS